MITKNKFKFFCTASNGFIEQYKYNGYVEELFDDSLLIPCQCTGMKDKNGKDVYENDLIGVFLDKNGFGVIKIGKVTFKHGAFCVEFLEPTSTMNLNFMHQLGPFEVIGCALEKMNIETFTEYKYAIHHKPTQKWVQFGNDDLELTVTTIELVDFKDCFINGNKDFMETFLKRSGFNNTPNYGNDNFLEFELVKVKATYTIEE